VACLRFRWLRFRPEPISLCTFGCGACEASLVDRHRDFARTFRGPEVLQLWSFTRFTSHYDVIANVLGAFIGTWVWRCFRRFRGSHVSVVVNRVWLIAGLGISVAILAIWTFPTRSSLLSDWEPDFSLMLGNETTNDRPGAEQFTALRSFAEPSWHLDSHQAPGRIPEFARFHGAAEISRFSTW
jgi:hypothetical protein